MDISRDGKRPMFFSRYSGPGSHRYPVGFSGDTYTTWRSLDFQPEFTATASNVGFSWWSHDIGGHYVGNRDDQLYLRWLQLGVFSPINRLHSSRNDYLRKEPWLYAPEIDRQAGRWLRLRHSLFPYIYTMNYRNHTELLPLVQPMYYSHPKCSGAPVFTIRAAQADTTLIPAERTWRIGLRGFHSGIAAAVQVDGKPAQAQCRWEQDTNTLWVTVAAATSSEVTVSVSGESLVTDNGDVRQRINTLIQKAQCTLFEKEAILKCLDDPACDLWKKFDRLIGAIMAGSLGEAIFELLALTEDPYTGSEIPE